MEHIDRILSYVRKQTQSYDGSHDINHAIRVAHNAAHICTNQQLRPLCIIVALTHDTCDRKYVDKEYALEHLHSFLCESLPGDDAAMIIRVVREISFSCLRENGPPKHLDSVCFYIWSVVADADMLDAMGMVGTLRTIMYQGHMLCKLEHGIDYALNVLTGCGNYMTHKLAMDEANRRRTTMTRLLHRMLEGSTPERQLGHFCITAGGVGLDFNHMLSNLKRKRYWNVDVDDEMVREVAWSEATHPVVSSIPTCSI